MPCSAVHLEVPTKAGPVLSRLAVIDVGISRRCVAIRAQLVSFPLSYCLCQLSLPRHLFRRNCERYAMCDSV